MSEPVIVLGKSFINAIIKVFVVREDNVASDIVQLGGRSVLINSVRRTLQQVQTYKAFLCNIS
jgi:hypothetical protein